MKSMERVEKEVELVHYICSIWRSWLRQAGQELRLFVEKFKCMVHKNQGVRKARCFPALTRSASRRSIGNTDRVFEPALKSFRKKKAATAGHLGR